MYANKNYLIPAACAFCLVASSLLPAWAGPCYPQSTATPVQQQSNLRQTDEPLAAVTSSTSTKNMVATVHPRATQAGLQAFAEGGNAVDAVIAAALTLGVVDGFNSGIGGGCFILIRTPEGNFIAIDGREMAPAAAHRDLYRTDGKLNPEAAQLGALAIGIPGATKAYFEAVEAHGRLGMKKLLEPAADIAEQGFVVTPGYASRLRSVASKLKKFPHSASILLRPDGKPWQAGEKLVQKELAATYRKLASQGVDWFYNGEFASRTAEWMQQHGGIITKQDFANYKTKRRTPIRTTYRNYEIVGFPPPSSGGVHVAQILNILETFDLAQLHREDPATFRHIVAEAMKLAFADRAYWLGDPDFVKVPATLISKKYARTLAAKIDRTKTTSVLSHGTPPNPDDKFFERHTTHVTAVDSAGYWVAMTTTVNTTFGSKVIVPGLGVVMNNQMDDFSIAPGVRNSFGLIGAENNSIEAGKRPLSSMSPTIVLKGGEPVFTAGAAGGPKIITEVLQATINHLDLKLPVKQAVGYPRIHHQWSPDRLLVETTLPAPLQKSLKDRGHQLRVSSSVGYCQAISFNPETKMFEGASDPRVSGLAAGQR